MCRLPQRKLDFTCRRDEVDLLGCADGYLAASPCDGSALAARDDEVAVYVAEVEYLVEALVAVECIGVTVMGL